jgi:hypothetical protein
MFDARTHSPLPTALAGGTAARVGGSLEGSWPLCMAHRTVPLTIDRGVTR